MLTIYINSFTFVLSRAHIFCQVPRVGEAFFELRKRFPEEERSMCLDLYNGKSFHRGW